MKPIKFDGCNCTYAEDQPQYGSLPVYKDDEQGGRVFHCWQMSWKERLRALFTGKIWVNVLNFNKPLQPIILMVKNPFKPAGKEKK